MIRLRASLRSKLLLAMALVLTPVLALLWADFRATLRRQNAAILKEQLLTAQAVAGQVDDAFEALIGFAWTVAAFPVAQLAQERRLNRLLAQLAETMPGVASISVHDADGGTLGLAIAKADVQPEPRRLVGPEVRRVIATNLQHVSDVVVLEPLGRVGLMAMVPIRDATAKAVGVVVVGVSTEEMARRFERSRLLPGQAILLADRNGRIAFHTEFRTPTEAQRQALAGTEPVRRALAGIQTADENFFSALLGHERLAAFVPTSRYRWVAAVTISRAIALAPVERAFRTELAVFVGILLGSVAVAILMARGLSDPVSRLESAAAAFGRGDLTRRVSITTGDELERLGDSFNTMAAQLSRMYEQERTLLRLREEFMQAAAHELKTPLATIRTTLHVALGLPSSPELGKVLESMGRQVTRISRLTDDLVTLMRLHGDAPLRLERLDLFPMIEDAIQRLADLSPTIPVTLSGHGPIPVEVDRPLMTLMLIRLLENAVASSAAGDQIEVAVTHGDDDAQVSVRDHGISVPPERRCDIFEPFYEAVPSGHAGYRGVVSLRLHLCKQVIEAHGGRIWMTAAADRGSMFSFSLPRARAGAESLSAERVAVAVAGQDQRNQGPGCGRAPSRESPPKIPHICPGAPSASKGDA